MTTPHRPPGRPSKDSLTADEKKHGVKPPYKPKRPVGRPRKNPLPTLVVPGNMISPVVFIETLDSEIAEQHAETWQTVREVGLHVVRGMLELLQEGKTVPGLGPKEAILFLEAATRVERDLHTTKTPVVVPTGGDTEATDDDTDDSVITLDPIQRTLMNMNGLTLDEKKQLRNLLEKGNADLSEEDNETETTNH